MPRGKKEKKAGVSIKCPGMDGPCSQCAGLSVEVTKPLIREPSK